MDGLGLNFKDERMETKHTPGPWALHPTALHPAVRSVGTAETGPRRICTVGTMNGNPVDKENARLIAAAPELLEAAIELKDVCNRPSAARTRAEAWRKLDKAIAKALQPNNQIAALAVDMKIDLPTIEIPDVPKIDIARITSPLNPKP